MTRVVDRLIAAVCVAIFSGRSAAADDTPICADKPTKSNNACTVAPGAWQLQTDLSNLALERSGGISTDTWLITNPTLKYGVAENLDIEANVAPYEIVRTHDTFGTRTISGIGDLFLRVKYDALPSGDVQLGFVPFAKLPTARDGIGNGAVEAGISAPVNITPSGAWSLGFSPEFDALKNARGDGRHFNTSQTVVVGYALPKDLTLYGEVWGD